MALEIILIETSALIEIEGGEVLKLLNRDGDCAKYSIIGFSEQIKLFDYRISGIEAIDKVISSEQVESFPKDFCFPAQVRISENQKDILIELFDISDSAEPKSMLWIATNLEEPIPDYKYSFFRIKPITKSLYAFVSLFNYYQFQKYFEGVTDGEGLLMQVETRN